MISIDDFADKFSTIFPALAVTDPWLAVQKISGTIWEMIDHLDDSYTIHNGIAIHKTAIVEPGAILKAPLFIQENCFVGAHAYLRGGVYLGKNSRIGPGCEIKTSIILENTATAHFNFIGDSIIGSGANFEAGSVIANHFNEKKDDEKWIRVCYKQTTIDTGVIKFGALVGDGARIGANAVLSPGTILEKNAIVKRLELIDQLD